MSYVKEGTPGTLVDPCLLSVSYSITINSIMTYDRAFFYWIPIPIDHLKLLRTQWFTKLLRR